ncbi:hypothetical protein N7535_006666 [Penicillium sp. DV-2018c]|nr:hypothetical protein N7461_007251 [Penicillium sp. DV-2018c]KAJ5567360.1 hypothetical protein N7535_006666 [Penicillium sp. DV-2018c]
MPGILESFLTTSGFGFFALILLALIGLTPVDAIYQCYETGRLTNIFFIIGAYVITFIIAALIYASRIYTNRSTLSGIPKAWIPVEKEDVSKSVRRLVKEGLAHSAIIAYQARPRDVSTDEESFQHYKTLLIDRERPPWGHIEHCGWSSPASPDLPNLPYRTVVQELPSLIEAKAVSLAPSDSFSLESPDAYGSPDKFATPDTRVVEVLRRPASMGLREYIRNLTSLGAIDPPELGADFLALYERARFSPHRLHETEFRELMHLFAEILRGMTSLAQPVLEEIRDSASYRRAYSESAIGNTDEEGYTRDTEEPYGYDGALEPLRSDSIRPSNSSTWDSQSGYDTAPSMHRTVSGLSAGVSSYAPRSPPRTPSGRSLRRVASGQSGSSRGSVIRLAQPGDPAELPYTINYAGRRQ